MISLLYVLLAIFCLSLLIFVHELGHYLVARHVGMRVIAFGIGFGKAIYSWKRDGVEWRINWFPLGGYVQIAGMDEKDSDKDEEEGWQNPAPDSFYGKSPWDRIKVAVAGPVANLFTALVIFTLIWAIGGRTKNFSDVTARIGWIDPHSQLYQAGIRPGDRVSTYGSESFRNSRDHLLAPLLANNHLMVSGYHYDNFSQSPTPFTYNTTVYPHPLDPSGSFRTVGILSPASFLVYNPKPGDLKQGLASGSPLLSTGIQMGDRLIWADGELLFSSNQLDAILNNDRVLLTIARGDEHLLTRVPRLYIRDLRIDNYQREELADWQYEAGLQKSKLQRLFMIPYNLDSSLVVEGAVPLYDSDKIADKIAPSSSSLDQPLQVGDRIEAVGGVPVKETKDFFARIQKPYKLFIVMRHFLTDGEPTLSQAEDKLSKEIPFDELNQLVASIGSPSAPKSTEHLALLAPVIPKRYADFSLTPDERQAFNGRLTAMRERFNAIEDPVEKNARLEILNKSESSLQVSPPQFSDLKVVYNPSPFAQFSAVLGEMWVTLKGLFTGNLSPKWLSGPVGIVEMVKENWKLGIGEGLYWVAMVSINLGVLNLLPIPILDGGNILLSGIEMVTGRRIKQSVLEKMILFCAVLLILFFLFVTYQDLLRIFGASLTRWV